jgi:hypothetical protein
MQSSSPLNSPPTPQHLEQIAAAKTLGKKISRAVGVAKLSGWTIAIFAVLTFLSGLFSFSAMVLGLGMGIVAYFELRGAGELKRLDPTAPRRLAINQLALAAILFLYGGWELLQSIRHPQSLLADTSSDPQVAQMLAPYQNFSQMIAVTIYLTVMIVAILGPGLTAVYYNSRRKYIEDYLRGTPEWIVQLQRAGMSV